MNRNLLNWLQLKADEWPTFAKMLWHSFFNSLGIAFSFTAINVLLIDLHGIEILPYIYLVGAFFVLLTGKIYAHLEARLPSVHLFAGVLAFCIVWALMTRGLAVMGDSVILLGILYCLYLAIYQLINLEFWGAAALIYDVRQSKRLFGLLSTGESVAKMGGYLMTPLIVTFFSLSDLLYFAAASFGLSFFFLFQLSRINNDALRVDHDHHHGMHRESFIEKIKKWIPSSKLSYLQLTSYFALFSALVYYLVHYSFLNRVEVRFDDVEQLAYFFGLFFGLGKFINLFIKAFLYSRFFNTLKIGYLVLAFPFIISILALGGFFGQFFAEDNFLLFLVIFGLIMLMDEILRSSVYLPSFFVLFQPLKKHQRLEGHTLAKGYMEPIGMGIAGFLMVSMLWLDIFTLSLVILFLTASTLLWLLFGWMTTHKYEEIVQHLLKNRLLTSRNILFSANESELLKKGDSLKNDPLSCLYRLKLAGNELKAEERSIWISDLFKTNDAIILYELLDIVSDLRHAEFLPEIRELIEHSNVTISQKAAFVYCSFTHEEGLTTLEDFILSSDLKRKEYLIAAVLRFSGIYGAIRFGKYIMDLLESDLAQERASSAGIVGLTGRQDYYHPLLKLLHDKDRNVRKQALIATSKVKNERLIKPVLKLFIDSDLSRFCALSLEEFGTNAVPEIRNEILKAHDKKTQVRLIKILGRISSDKSIEAILDYIESEDFEIRTAAIDAAYRNNYSLNKKVIFPIVNRLFKSEYELFMDITILESVLNEAVERAIRDEFKSLKSRMLKLMGLMYRKQIIQKAIDNLRYDNNSLKGNVLEMLENELRLTHSRKLTKVLEFEQKDLFIENRKNTLKLDLFVKKVMGGDFIGVCDWTIAVMLRCCKSKGHIFEQQELDSLLAIRSEVILQELNKN